MEIPITTTGQDGATGADYSGVLSNVIFNSGDTAQTFTFTATQDTDNDDGESVKLALGALPDRVTAGATSAATVSITDDDDPPVTASFEQSSYTVAEGSTVEVTVTLSLDPERTVEIPITTTDQDGATGADYSVVPANVTFDSGDTQKTVTFTATQDAEDDDGESVKLAFGTLPNGVTAGTPGETTVSITDDDVPSVTVSFEQAAYTVAEGGSVTVSVTLSADPERTVEIPIAKTNLGGASESDYSGVPASVEFSSGETSKSFSFSAAADNLEDSGESVRLSLGTPPAGVVAGATDEATVSILNQSPQNTLTVRFEAGASTVSEGGTTTVTVILSTAPGSEVVIPLKSTNLGGATDSDYSGVPATLTFGSSDTEKSFTFTATDDAEDDDDEIVNIGFGTLPNGVTAGTPGEATVSITDDDVPSVTISFEQAEYTVAEGSSVTVSVTLSADPERTVEIPITTTDQDGATGADYSGVPVNVTFNSGDTQQTFTFTATQDAEDDDDESVKLAFGTLPNGVTAGTPGETTVSITDDDVPSVTVSFEQAAYTVAEGGSVTVSVTLSADPERTVEIPIAKTNLGGASESDYSGVPASVEFSSGETSKSFSFSAAADNLEDSGESVRLSLGTPPAGVVAGATDEATVSILNQSPQNTLTVRFEAGASTVSEGGTTTVTVILSTAPGSEVVIPLKSTNLGGATDSDYSGVPATLTFGSSDTEKSFTFTATDDAEDDDDEIVNIGFGTLPNGVTAGTPGEATVSITDDDVPSVTVSFEQAEYTVDEGSSVTVSVTLSADPERTVEIPVTTTPPGRRDRRRLFRRPSQRDLRLRRHGADGHLHGDAGRRG